MIERIFKNKNKDNNDDENNNDNNNRDNNSVIQKVRDECSGMKTNKEEKKKKLVKILIK